MIILKEIIQKVENENLTSQVDGINQDFTVSNNFSTLTKVHLAGLLQEEGATKDYIVTSSNTFQFVKAPKIGMTVFVDYVKE